MNNLLPVVVLIGGNGSNLQAMIDSPLHHSVYQIVGVISHRPEAFGLKRASQQGIPTQVVDHLAFSDRNAFESALAEAIVSFSPKLILMAGFMRVLSATFTKQFTGKLLNIHPSLLPHYKGLNTHQRVLEAKEKEHGISVHFVNEELDGGPIVAQVRVPISASDNVDSLTKKIHQAEHWLYPQVVGWFAKNRLKYNQNIVTLDEISLGPYGKQLTFALT